MKKTSVGLLAAVAGTVTGTVIRGYLAQKIIEQKQNKADKFRSYYNVLNQWLILKLKGVCLEQYFLSKGMHNIAIYGMGELGCRLLDELKGSEVEVKYAIDKNAASTYAEIKLLDIEDSFEAVDAIVVTAIFAYEEIEDTLKDRVDFPIISLEDIIFEL